MAAEGFIFGPMLVGVFLNCILYGATVVQTYIYFQTYKRDEWWMKMFVIYLLVWESLNTVFDIGVVFEPLILRYGTPEVFTNAPIMLCTNPLSTVMISLPVQLFIAWRVKMMSKSNVLPIIITFFAVASFVGGIATTLAVILINFEYSEFHQNDGAVITWLASSAAADVIITVSLVYNLLHKRTGFAATDDIINRIIRLTIQTGFLTAVSATLDVALFLALKGQTWNYIWDLALSKLYSNSILSTLNARGGWKATSTIRDNILFENATSRESVQRSRAQIEVSVTTEIQSRRQSSSNTMPMKVFGSGSSFVHEDYSASVIDETRPRLEQSNTLPVKAPESGSSDMHADSGFAIDLISDYGNTV